MKARGVLVLATLLMSCSWPAGAELIDMCGRLQAWDDCVLFSPNDDCDALCATDPPSLPDSLADLKGISPGDTVRTIGTIDHCLPAICRKGNDVLLEADLRDRVDPTPTAPMTWGRVKSLFRFPPDASQPGQ